MHAKPKLFVVEPGALITPMLRPLTTKLGWTMVGTAANAQDAVVAVLQARPSVAIVDVNLGEAGSLEVAEVCTISNIPVLFITGTEADQVPTACADLPVLAKPFSQDQFVDAIRAALAGSSLNKQQFR